MASSPLRYVMLRRPSPRLLEISRAKVASASQLLGAIPGRCGLSGRFRPESPVASTRISSPSIVRKNRPATQCFEQAPTAPRSVPAGHLPSETNCRRRDRSNLRSACVPLPPPGFHSGTASVTAHGAEGPSNHASRLRLYRRCTFDLNDPRHRSCFPRSTGSRSAPSLPYSPLVPPSPRSVPLWPWDG